MLKKIDDNIWKVVYGLTEVIEYKHLNIDDYIMYWKNGKFTKIFPNYDSKKHSLHLLGHPENSRVNNYFIAELHIPRTDTDPLPNGLYVFKSPDYHDYILEKLEIRNETFLQTEETTKLVEDVQNFFNCADKYRASNLHHKRGALLFGPQGAGKTTSINQVLLSLKSKDGIGIIVPAHTNALDELQRVQEAVGDRPLVVIFEEITERLREDRSSILSFLDGQFSTKNTYFIATTNYPEELPANLIDRPGRFDILLEYGNPTIDQIRSFIKQTTQHEITSDEEELFKGYSWAYVREIVTQYHLTGKSIIEIYNNMKTSRQKFSNTFKGGFGLR